MPITFNKGETSAVGGDKSLIDLELSCHPQELFADANILT